MKKLSLISITALLVLSLAGCGGEPKGTGDKNVASGSEVTSEDNSKKSDTEGNTDSVENSKNVTSEGNIEESKDANNSGDKLIFSTEDIDGNPVTEEILQSAKVVMINFWEPWCGPCVGEMPDIEKLYEEYKEEGFLVLGVFSTLEMEDAAREILEDLEIQYPILKADDNLVEYMTDYVPTTFFVDGKGNLLSDEPLIGARSYDAWKKIIEGYLN